MPPNASNSVSTSTYCQEQASCQELSHVSKKEFTSFLNSFDCVMTDCDGVLWIGDDAIEGSAEAISLFRRLGKKVFYCTNNSTKTRDEYLVKVSTLGFGGRKDDIIGTSFLCVNYLKEINYDGKVYVIGSPGVTRELTEAGIECSGGVDDPLPEDWTVAMADRILEDLGAEYRCVIVGFDRNFNYLKLAKAASLLSRSGSIYLTTNSDRTSPHKGKSKEIVIPSTAVLASAVTTASGKHPVDMGKPSPRVFQQVQKVYPEIQPERTLMIGDRANTDVLLGKNCNLQTLLVGSGVHSLKKIREWETKAETRRLVPDFYADKLGDIVALAEKAGF